MSRFAVCVVLGLVVALLTAAPAHARAVPSRPPAVASVSALQARLIELGYLAPTALSGRMDEATRQAVLAFQGWEGLRRDGVPGRATRARLASARRPEPDVGRGSRIEIDLSRQVALLARGRQVVRAIHVSTGASGRSTPTGRFRVYRKERESWSVPFRVWLPWTSYFSGGVALHGYRDVPPYPASHGCVRIPLSEAPTVYAFARLACPSTSSRERGSR